jgi:hypothetical protein
MINKVLDDVKKMDPEASELIKNWKKEETGIPKQEDPKPAD